MAKEAPLTRELVRDMIADGRTVRDVATTLGISTQAVYKHMAKLGITTGRRAGDAADG